MKYIEEGRLEIVENYCKKAKKKKKNQYYHMVR